MTFIETPAFAPVTVEEPVQPQITEEQRKVADALERSADLIEKQGWTRGTLRDVLGRRCALGAIRVATLYGEETGGIYKPVLRAFVDVLVPSFKSDSTERLQHKITSWNDTKPNESGKEVVRKFREAAARVLSGN